MLPDEAPYDSKKLVTSEPNPLGPYPIPKREYFPALMSEVLAGIYVLVRKHPEDSFKFDPL